MLPAVATETLTVCYPTIVTSRGTTEYVYSTSGDSITVSGCSVQPTTTSSDVSDPRTQTLSLYTAWIPEAQWARVIAGGTTLKHLAYIWRGEKYVQYGDAMEWHSPTGLLGHTQMYLRRYEG